MNASVLKVWVWIKIALFALIVVYILYFVIANYEEMATISYFPTKQFESPVLILVLLTFLLGGLTTLLVRTTISTVRQIRGVRQKSRTDKLEREVAEMRGRTGKSAARD